MRKSIWTKLAAVVAVAGACVLPAGASAAESWAEPNDTYFWLQWQIADGDALDLRRAWMMETLTSVPVAVVDSGVAEDEPDVQGALWVNEGEIPGNGIDDDGNGFTDDVHGFDFVNETPLPRDENGHGTAMASIIAAPVNDSQGLAGVSWNARVMALKVADANGDTTGPRVARAIRYAVANGARVINFSLAVAADEAVGEAVAEARAAGVLMVAAAGNSSRDVDENPPYPAAYDREGVLSVASVSETGGLSKFSNYGVRTVQLAAPGEAIPVALPGEYAYFHGTSAASAEVAGLLAILVGYAPQAPAEQIRGAVLSTARPVPGGVSAGVPDAFAALRALGAPDVAPLPPAAAPEDEQAAPEWAVRRPARPKRARRRHRAHRKKNRHIVRP